MKKKVLVLFLSTIALGVFAQDGVIRQLSGTVELMHPGTTNFVAAAIGDEVRQDTVISTGFRSNALIAVGNSTLITVRPLTRLTLTEISSAAGTETLNANLQAGRVRVDVTPPAGTRASMTVSSPSATASVRGTTLLFDGKNIGVTGGIVEFQGDRGTPVLVGHGFFAGLDNLGMPTDPVFVSVGTVSPELIGLQPELPGSVGMPDPLPPSVEPPPPPRPPGGGGLWPPPPPPPPPVDGGGNGGGNGGNVNINITY